MVNNEGKSYENHQHVHFEIESEIDDVRQDDKIKYLALQLIGNFLG